MRVQYRQETATFHFVNVNPKGKNTDDCVARAISVALGQTWEQTIREMTELGISIGYPFNNDKTVVKYLEKKGWTYCKEPRDVYNKKITLEQFMNTHAKGVYIVKPGSHHVSLVVDGVCWDSWNCTKKTMHSYFVPPRDYLFQRDDLRPEKAPAGPTKRRFIL